MTTTLAQTWEDTYEEDERLAIQHEDDYPLSALDEYDDLGLKAIQLTQCSVWALENVEVCAEFIDWYDEAPEKSLITFDDVECPCEISFRWYSLCGLQTLTLTYEDVK
ncbi:MAG: hypothetical protein F6K56_03110 [Moorea sp. SIO3G5]|nr:hypothetical protein [Moorena sp. SIO3G5]